MVTGLLGISGQSKGALLVIDSFDQGAVNLSIDGSVQDTQNGIGDRGVQRYMALIPADRDAAPETTVTASVDPLNPGLSFTVDGFAILPRLLLDLRVQYGRDSRLLLAGYSAFEFEILSVSGSGNLILDMGTLAPNDSDVTVIELTGPGIVRVPFSEVVFDPNQPSLIGFSVQARSGQFSVKLGQFSAIPEPSQFLMSAVGLSVALMMRRRPEDRSLFHKQA